MSKEVIPNTRDEQPLGEMVYQRLTEMIISGELAPGEPLRETRIATDLGTSRVPVREALQRLSDDGWVTRVPRSGARVRVPTAEEVDEVFDLRVLLEAEAVRLAVRYVSLADADLLRALIDEGQSAAARGDTHAVVETNRRFHSAVAALSNNRLLCDMLSMLDRRTRWLFGSVAVHRLEEHTELVDALFDRDVDTAVGVITRHVTTTRALLHERWHPSEPS